MFLIAFGCNIFYWYQQKQERNRVLREILIENTTKKLYDLLKNSPLEAVNLKEIFEHELFGLSMKQVSVFFRCKSSCLLCIRDRIKMWLINFSWDLQALGEDVQSIYVDELGITMSRHEIFECLVHDPMMGAIEVDWRDFFPYLKWVPNKSFENKIEQMDIRRQAVMKSLIQDQLKKRSGEEEVPYTTFSLIL